MPSLQPSTSPFPPIEVCVFDAYGTLFDVHSAVARHAGAVGPQAEAVSRLWRLKQLEYSWTRSLMRRYADFWAVTQEGLDFALASHGLADQGLREPLLDAYRSLACHVEVPAMLAALRAMGVRTAILSNGSPAMLAAAVESAGIGGLLDAVLSVEEVGVYKPDPSVYAMALERLGVAPGAACFQSSNPWDAAAAAANGFQVVWINRSGQPLEYGWVLRGHELRDLSGLPEIVGRSRSLQGR
jgi:2-haloacid dehalogenase